MVSQKLLEEFTKSLATDFQLKSVKSSEILSKICFLNMIEKKPIKLYNLIFRFALAFSKHRLKMPVLALTLFGPQFSFSQQFEQRKCSLLRFLYGTVLDDLFQIVACFYAVEQCSAINSLSIASAQQRSKSDLCNLKLCVTFVSMQKLLYSYLSAFATSYYAHIVSL